MPRTYHSPSGLAEDNKTASAAYDALGARVERGFGSRAGASSVLE